MKKAVSILCAILLLLCIPSTAWAKDLGISRQQFIGAFIDGALLTGYDHFPDSDNYFHDTKDPSIVYFYLTDCVGMMLECGPTSDTVNNISVIYAVGGGDAGAKDFITCIGEIAYALGVLPHLDPANPIYEYAFLADMGFEGAKFTDGENGRVIRNGYVFQWKVDYANGGIFFFVDPAR